MNVLYDGVNNGHEKKQTKNDEPAGGNQGEATFYIVFVAEVNFLFDAKKAEHWRVFPNFFVVKCGVRNDGVVYGVFFVGVKFLVPEKRVDAESVFGGDVDVAGVDDERAGFNGLVKVDGANVVFDDATFFPGFAGDGRV